MGERLVKHDGKYYREVQRKAREGELVKITKGLEGLNVIGKVVNVYNKEGNISVDLGDACDYFPFSFREEYVVLEEVPTDQPCAACEELTDRTARLAVANTAFEPLTRAILASDLPVVERLELALDYERRTDELWTKIADVGE